MIINRWLTSDQMTDDKDTFVQAWGKQGIVRKYVEYPV